MKKTSKPLVDTTLGTEVPVAAMSAPKIPPLQGEGAAASIVVVTTAISSPKLPPLQGD